MTFYEKKTYYFDKPGAANTADAAKFAIERAHGVQHQDHRGGKYLREDVQDFLMTR